MYFTLEGICKICVYIRLCIEVVQSGGKQEIVDQDIDEHKKDLSFFVCFLAEPTPFSCFIVHMIFIRRKGEKS